MEYFQAKKMNYYIGLENIGIGYNLKTSNKVALHCIDFWKFSIKPLNPIQIDNGFGMNLVANENNQINSNYDKHNKLLPIDFGSSNGRLER